MFRFSCPPVAWARSTSSTPTCGGVIRLVTFGENKPFSLLVKQERVEIVSESDGGERPGSFETRTISVASADSVCSDQSNDFLVAEAEKQGQYNKFSEGRASYPIRPKIFRTCGAP